MAETHAELSHGLMVDGGSLSLQQPGSEKSPDQAGPDQAGPGESSQPAVSDHPSTTSGLSATAQPPSATAQPPSATGQRSSASEQSPAAYAPAEFPAGFNSATGERAPNGSIHHVELWVPNLDKAIVSWGWLLTSLGYRMFQDWPGGRSWQSGHAYIVVEQSPDRTASRHDRCRPGLNHLAFHVASRELVDQLTGEALLHGWKLMFADSHPYAGGPQHYAAYLENSDGFEAELVAD